MKPPIAIKPVTDDAGKRAFLEVPFAIYRDDSNWVAPLFLERREHLDPGKNPYFKHADVQLFIAEREGRAIGRISAQIDRLRTERYNDGIGQFGFLEAPDEAEVFRSLIGAAASWLAQRGMKHMQGPYSFSINDEMGCLIDGFNTPPSMMMGHARPYYGTRIEEQGFAKAKDVIAYWYDNIVSLPRSMSQMFDKAVASGDYEFRPLDKKDQVRELDLVIDIFNDAWSGNWGFVPFTREEIEALGKNLRMLVTGGYVSIASYKGEPAAMVVTLPNINEWIAGLGGRLLPFGWAQLAWHLFAKAPYSIRMVLTGVRKKYHGTLVGSALAIGAIETVRRYHASRGTVRGELSWILEDNIPMRKLIEQIGAKPYKTYRIYQRTIA